MGLHTFETRTLKARGAFLLFHDQKLLLCRQNEKSFWVLPGGTLEEGESIEACTVREAMEEFSLTLAPVGLLCVSEFQDAKRHVLDFAFLTRYTAGPLAWAPPHPENINEVAWVDAEAFARLSLKPERVQKFILEHWATLAATTLPNTGASPYLGMDMLD